MNFITLLKQEWIKIQSLRSLVFLLLCILVMIGMSTLSFAVLGLPPEVGELTAQQINNINPFGMLLSAFSGTFAMIASLYFMMQYGDEYKYGLIRKNVIDGMGRRDLFNGKMLFLFGSYLLWTVLVLKIFILVGVVRLNGNLNLLLGSIQMEQLVKYYLHIIFYGAFAFSLVSLFRSTTMPIIFFLGIHVVEQLLNPALQYFEMDYLIPYLPIELATTIRSADTISTGEIIAYLSYLVGFIGLGQWNMYKRDL